MKSNYIFHVSRNLACPTFCCIQELRTDGCHIIGTQEIFVDGTSLVVQWLRTAANAGNMGLIPGPGRSHMPWSNQAPVPQPLSLRAWELQQEKPLR